MALSWNFLTRYKFFIATALLMFGVLDKAIALDLATTPLFLTQGAEPLVMLNMSKDHQLYFKAYDDYSDINKDGIPDTTYRDSIDYYGYFDAKKCYVYSGTSGRFEPSLVITSTTDHYCDNTSTANQWSGNFLNWATMTRIDTVRKILYGGYRATDSGTDTTLERSFLPNDAHSFAKYYNGTDLGRLTPFTSAPSGQSGIAATGITLCNTTVNNANALSQDVTDPPLMRVAKGNFSLWAANERWQCRWIDEKSDSNGNVVSTTGLYANSSNPSSSTDGLTIAGVGPDFNVRVQACVTGMVKSENCKTYPNGNLKPVGLLQNYGDTNSIRFGLLTGSFGKNKSGGLLRRQLGSISDEVNVSSDGTFVTTALTGGNIIKNLNRLRIYGYRYEDGTYFGVTNSDNCSWGLSSFNNGDCSNWGNPQSEIYMEALRYIAGKTPTSAFDASDPLGLTKQSTWTAPVSNTNYCAAINLIQFNASTSSYDSDDLATASDLGISNLSALTDAVGDAEGITGHDYFVGETPTDTNQLCTAKTINNLSSAKGTCPDAPRLGGSYQMAGLAKFARTQDLMSSVQDSQTVKTYGVALSPAVPRVSIAVPGSTTNKKITIQPACRNTSLSPAGNCAVVDFKIVAQTSTSSANSGVLYVNWEDSEQGGDFDQDMWGVISYTVTAGGVSVTTDVAAQSTPYSMGFGYVIGGTTSDGFYAHSGINGFAYAAPSSVPAGASLSGCSSCASGDAATTNNYIVGSSSAKPLEQPLFYASKWGAFVDSDSSATPNLTSEWDSDGDGIPDSYAYATNPAQLEASLGKALDAVAKEAGAASAVAANSTRLDNGSTIYQARFNSNGWTGQLLAYPVSTAGVIGAAQWDAGAAGKIPSPSARKVFTYNPVAGTGRALTWSNLSSAQHAALQASSESDTTNAQLRLQWLIGARDQEQPTGSLRTRTQLLGDIVNSDPVFSGAQDFHYEQLPDLTTGATTYQAYVTTKKARTPVIFVGANDGFLHAIKANGGEELFAYMPSGTFSNAIKLTRPDYGAAPNPHLYFVDGPLFVGDAYIAARGGWRTVLVGTMGAGGKNIFALDVSDPTNFSASDVLFELNGVDHTELGNVMGQPLVVRMADGRWAAVFGNGYNSSSGCGHLFVVDLAAPTSIEKIPTESCGDNGLSGVSLLNSSGTVLYAFAGDLLGNMWKFDLTDSTVTGSGAIGWESAYKTGSTPQPLFRAKDAAGVYQPITSAPVLGRNAAKNDALMVYFGTGRYLATGDNTVSATPQVQSVYGIVDGTAIPTTYTSRTDIPLHEKIISAQTTTARTITEGDIHWSSVKGWFMDLRNPGAATGSGERVVSKPLLLFDRLLLTTLIPSSDPCSFGGSGWLLEVGGSGDDDATFSLLSTDGIYQPYAVPKLSSFIKGGETGYLPTSNIRGDLSIIPTPIPPEDGRQSWRQLR